MGLYSAHMWDFNKGAAFFFACLFALESTDVYVSLILTVQQVFRRVRDWERDREMYSITVDLFSAL